MLFKNRLFYFKRNFSSRSILISIQPANYNCLYDRFNHVSGTSEPLLEDRVPVSMGVLAAPQPRVVNMLFSFTSNQVLFVLNFLKALSVL